MDDRLIYSFFLLFVRTGALLLTAPLFGGFGIPTRVRVGLGAIVALALAPVVQAKVGAMPSDALPFISALGREVVIGVVIGTLLQVVTMAAQAAGHFIDLQIGFGITHLLNPATGQGTSILANFKMMAAVLFFLLVDGHHIVFRALVASYDVSPAIGMAQLPGMKAMLMDVIFRMFMLSLQIAAPGAAVAFLTDAGLAAVARAVPQMNVLIVGFPAKIILGLSGVIVGLPVLLWGTREGLRISTDAIQFFLRGSGA